MAAALPVVTSRTGHLDQLVTDIQTGLVVPPGCADALAAALTRLAADPSAARSMGARARAQVLANHTWDATAERVLSRALGAAECAA